mgnify:CR=1 FL=1
MAATMLAIVSLIGMLHQIPAAPMKVGKMIRHGSRNSNWRVSDRNIALFAIPILWKKLDVNLPENCGIWGLESCCRVDFCVDLW